MTCENQQRADERIPILFQLPFKHKGIMVAPFIGAVSIKNYVSENQIEQVIAGGENYDGARPCHYEWIKSLYDECVEGNIKFCFIETGTNFVKDGKTYHLPNKKLQSIMAYKSGLQFIGKDIDFKLAPTLQNDLFGSENIYHKYFCNTCQTCGSKLICNGCSQCGNCTK